MDKMLLNEIIECLPKERTLFHYFKDRYALMLLSYYLDNQPQKISTLRQTAFAKLLQKPSLRPALALAGQGTLSPQHLAMVWGQELHFLLGITSWGNRRYDTYYQTSRTGYNLVLQLNFSNQHEQAYQRLVKPSYEAYFNCYAHPTMQDKKEEERFRETLAWARIDLDFDSDEALIEEIQSDWIKEVISTFQRMKLHKDEEDKYYECGLDAEPAEVITYFNTVLKPYINVWEEAMLTAAIEFIRNELGIHNIYYHTYETGCALKHCEPPRSLYTTIPRKFCFQETDEMPSFLNGLRYVKKNLRKVAKPRFFKLHL
ncbi:hypothetical protein [Candidatus Albibeggiatoa sp. nov. NOAA]|uniref:hypothetical protein n=1 Tax=Candidatus Albibeggiatoa sp. nov. NOAA TaxID=3162724 RepID=UPI003303EB95|nr:hypothetical protein [Thiotrichaceae bacterium]